ncbi:MAG: DUF885 domain-containing protein [bacterium]
MNVRLLKLEKEFLKLYCAFHPVTSTSLGFAEHNGELADHDPRRIKNYLQDLSGIHRRLSLLRATKNVAAQERVDFTLLENKILLEDKELTAFRPQHRDPSLYVSEILYGLWFLLVRPFSKEERLEGVLRRLHQVPALFSQARALLKNPPRVWVTIALHEVEGLLYFLKDCRDQLLRTYPKARRELQKAFEKAQEEALAFKKYLKLELLKEAHGKFAVGKKDFDFLLRKYHGLSEDSGQILKLGKEVFLETQELLQQTASQIRKGVRWERVVDEIKKDHPGVKNLLKTYQAQVARTKRFIREKKLVAIPAGERLRVIETPAFARSTIPFAAYIDPPLFAEDRTGTFFLTPVTASDPKTREALLQEHCHASLAVTALHEGYPGHHLQFVYQAGISSPLRKIFNSSSYYEGWALYCEEMMSESGFYDAPARLLQLKDRLWRACRVIVDVGMHTQGMTDDEAVDFLSKNARMAKASARADVNWYTQRPTVPLSYLTGMKKIMSLRDEAKKKWGESFSLKKFHEWFLGFGAIPIPLIRGVLKS